MSTQVRTRYWGRLLELKVADALENPKSDYILLWRKSGLRLESV